MWRIVMVCLIAWLVVIVPVLLVIKAIAEGRLVVQ